MKKLKSTIILATVGLSLLSFSVLAQTPPAGPGGIIPVTVPQQIDIDSTITKILNWAFGLLLALATAFILYAAFLYLTASGDAERVTSAKNVIIYAVVAIAVAFAARGLVAIVRNFLV